MMNIIFIDSEDADQRPGAVSDPQFLAAVAEEEFEAGWQGERAETP